MNSTDKEPSLVVRRMEPRDAADVTLLVRQLGYDRAVEEVASWIADLCSDADRQAAFVACSGEEIAGWVEVSIQHRLQTPPFGLIGGLVVKEGMRGGGIGQRLCEQAESWCWERQVSMVRVTSRSTRADAHRFYQRRGYSQVKTSLVFEKKRSK